MEELVRVRLVFEDPHVLTKSQRVAGLRRCWLLLKPDIATVGDLAAHVALRFALHTPSAADIVLSMDGYVLPDFESTSIFKDKDIISVRSRDHCMKEVTETENLEKQLVVTSHNILPIKNSTEDSREYKHKAEDVAYAINDKTVPMESPSDENANSRRKRKHSDVLQGSKRKKLKSTRLDRQVDNSGDVENNHLEQTVTTFKSSLRTAKTSKGDIASPLAASQADVEVEKTPASRKKRRKKLKSTRFDRQVDNSGDVENNHLEQTVTTLKSSLRTAKTSNGDIASPLVASQTDVEVEKTPASRKKRKKELIPPSLENLDGTILDAEHVVQEVTTCKSTKKKENLFEGSRPDAVVTSQDDGNTEKTDASLNMRNDQDEAKCQTKLPSRSTRRKKDKRQWLRELRKSQLEEHKESQIPANDIHKKSPEGEMINQNNGTVAEDDTEVVPVVIRPRHIRFEPIDAEQNTEQPNGQVVPFQWNGTTSKKKGQKWGQEKTDDNATDEDPKEKEKSVTGDGITVEAPIDFKCLLPLSRAPAEGDVIAYQLVELSSTWCPELSSVRVGKVSSYDSISMRIVLAPVRGHSIFPADENAECVSVYKEDGSLEIDFPSLVDVRLFKSVSSEETAVHFVQRETTEVSAPAPVSNLKVSEKVAPVNNLAAAAPENHLNVTVNNQGVATAPASNVEVALSQKTVAEKIATVDTWEAAPVNVPENVAPVINCEVAAAPVNVPEKVASTDIWGEVDVVNNNNTEKVESAVNWGVPLKSAGNGDLNTESKIGCQDIQEPAKDDVEGAGDSKLESDIKERHEIQEPESSSVEENVKGGGDVNSESEIKECHGIQELGGRQRKPPRRFSPSSSLPRVKPIGKKCRKLSGDTCPTISVAWTPYPTVSKDPTLADPDASAPVVKNFDISSLDLAANHRVRQSSQGDMVATSACLVRCPFDSCRALPYRDSQVPRGHLHILRFREWFLSGERLASLIAYLLSEGLWLCFKCCGTYVKSRRCSCGFYFGDNDEFPIRLVDGHTLPSSSVGLVPEVPCIEPSPSFAEDPALFSLLLKNRCQTVAFVPERCRSLFARTFVSLLEAVHKDPKDLKLWAYLLIFPKCILRFVHRVASRKGSSANLAKIIQERLQIWCSGVEGIELLWKEVNSVRSSSRVTSCVEMDNGLQLAKNVLRCKNLIRQGRLGDACRSLTSDGIAAPSDDVVAALRDLHPPAPSPTLTEGQLPDPIIVDECVVLKAISSFPLGTACGLDGLRAQHLSDMIYGVSTMDYEVSTMDYGRTVLALTSHVNLMLRADLPPILAPTFASARLVALRKPSGGIRPIAVGEIWRRLAAKVAVSHCRGQALEYLSPLQVGVAVPLGAEAIVHAVNRTVEKLGGDTSRGLLKFDFTNAFNTVSRDKVFSGVRQHFPGLSRWVEYIYAGQPTLYFEDVEIASAAGVQQGDPLGPLLFAAALQPLLLDLQATFPNLDINAWYLDDGIIIGERLDLVRALYFVQRNAPLYGLHLNEAKCEIWWPGSSSTSWADFPSSIQSIHTSTIGLLGGLIINCDWPSQNLGAESVVLQRVTNIKATLQRLRELCDPHMQLFLLRVCCGFPKFNFVLRTCPPSCIPDAIKIFDQVVEDALSDIWNTDFNFEQRQLISLPLRHGGLNIHLASRSALSAFTGSAAQSVTLQNQLMHISSVGAPSTWASLALTKWNSTFSPDKPVALQDLLASRNPQHLLSEIIDSRLLNALLQNAGPRFKTVIHAASADYSPIWTTAFPIPHLGLTMFSAAFWKVLRYRTRHPIYSKPQS